MSIASHGAGPERTPSRLRASIARTLQENLPGGIITRDVLKKVLWEWNDAAIDAALEAVGASGDGCISSEDFLASLFFAVNGSPRGEAKGPTAACIVAGDPPSALAAVSARLQQSLSLTPRVLQLTPQHAGQEQRQEAHEQCEAWTTLPLQGTVGVSDEGLGKVQTKVPCGELRAGFPGETGSTHAGTSMGLAAGWEPIKTTPVLPSSSAAPGPWLPQPPPLRPGPALLPGQQEQSMQQEPSAQECLSGLWAELRAFRNEVQQRMSQQQSQLTALEAMFGDLQKDLQQQAATRLPDARAPAFDQEACMKALGAVLENPIKIDEKAANFWQEHAEFDRDGAAGLSLEKAQGVSFRLADCLGIPHVVLADLGWNLFPRFDFNGDGRLSKKEFQKMCRCMIRQRWVEYGGQLEQVPVPQSTVHGQGYILGDRLGSGGQGSMYLATREGSSKQFCIKCYHKQNSNTGGLKAIIEEFRLMGELNNRHIAKNYDIFQDQTYYYLVNEPYFGGDLTKLVRRASERGVSMSENWWRNIFRQMLTGLEYLHDNAVTHCDIKESNIMIAARDSYRAPRAVLIDFGLAQPFSAVMGSICGTPGYIPPETYQVEYRNHWFPHGDIFSLGIVFFQLLSGTVQDDDWDPILVQGASTMEEYAFQALNKELPWCIFPWMMELRDLIDRMTIRTFTLRPRVPQCLDHEWFSCGSDASWPSDMSGPVSVEMLEQAIRAQVPQSQAGTDLTAFPVYQQEDTLASPPQAQAPDAVRGHGRYPPIPPLDLSSP